MKLSKAVSLYAVELHQTHTKSTCDSYMFGVKRFVKFFNIDVKLKKIRFQTLTEWQAHLLERLKPRTVLSYSKGVKSFFTWARDFGLIDKNPAKKMTIREPKDSMVKAIEEHDYEKILDAATARSTRSLLFVRLLADTGGRLREIASIKVADIEFQHDVQCGFIAIVGKGGKPRYLRFNPETYSSLHSYLLFARVGDGPYLFPGKKKNSHLHTNTFRGELYDLAEKVGCAGRVNPHSFRHRFAKIYLRNGGDISSLSKQLGHSSVAITIKYYIAWDDAELNRLHRMINPARVDFNSKLS